MDKIEKEIGEVMDILGIGNSKEEEFEKHIHRLIIFNRISNKVLNDYGNMMSSYKERVEKGKKHIDEYLKYI